MEYKYFRNEIISFFIVECNLLFVVAASCLHSPHILSIRLPPVLPQLPFASQILISGCLSFLSCQQVALRVNISHLQICYPHALFIYSHWICQLHYLYISSHYALSHCTKYYATNISRCITNCICG
jgi:hypothetical protein